MEADVSYLCLNQLFPPVHADLDRLPPGPRKALAALGFGTFPAVVGCLMRCRRAASTVEPAAEKRIRQGVATIAQGLSGRPLITWNDIPETPSALFAWREE
ncbi:hypothetical protein [Acrocarpospora sp. B8E8]|uniref:hypothetical protein n=1 Tax=Acrocarpospora sp. B8E8 TaxID=3153572 RepID=UPI00325D21AC